MSAPGCHGQEARKPLSPLLLILLPLAQRSKEGKEVCLFKCQTEISSFKDKRYGGRRSRAWGDRQAGDSRGRRGHTTSEGISRGRTACNQHSTLLSWNLEQDPALAALHIPMQPATSLPPGSEDGVGSAARTHRHWHMGVPVGLAAACWPQVLAVSCTCPKKACVSLLGFSREELLLIRVLEREGRERGRSGLYTPLCYKTSARTKQTLLRTLIAPGKCHHTCNLLSIPHFFFHSSFEFHSSTF